MATVHALSYLCAGYLVDLVTLGAPMVGDAAFVKVMETAADPATLLAGAGGGGGGGSGGGAVSGSARGLLQACRLVNSADVVPKAQAPLRGYVHFPLKPVVLDHAGSAVGTQGGEDSRGVGEQLFLPNRAGFTSNAPAPN
jgi:hypothetical protein